jgi:hypothetical protein
VDELARDEENSQELFSNFIKKREMFNFPILLVFLAFTTRNNKPRRERGKNMFLFITSARLQEVNHFIIIFRGMYIKKKPLSGTHS